MPLRRFLELIGYRVPRAAMTGQYQTLPSRGGVEFTQPKEGKPEDKDKAPKEKEKVAAPTNRGQFCSCKPSNRALNPVAFRLLVSIHTTIEGH
jgi:hypothetical protein